eukprot:8792085-Pyramimonas_sp.AAC.1
MIKAEQLSISADFHSNKSSANETAPRHSDGSGETIERRQLHKQELEYHGAERAAIKLNIAAARADQEVLRMTKGRASQRGAGVATPPRSW